MRMEQIRHRPLPANVQFVMKRWADGIAQLQRCRQDEIVNAANRRYMTSPQMQKEKGLRKFTVTYCDYELLQSVHVHHVMHNC